MIRVTTNPNKQLVNEIRAKIKDNNGHCACAVSFNDSNVCVCQDCRDQIERGESGECHCGLYIVELT